MSGWGDREFQRARKEKSLDLHTIQVQFDKERDLLPVSQYYSTRTNAVQCLIIPNQVVSLLQAPSMTVETKPDECILVWQNHHADVYDKKKMEFKRSLGTILFNPRVWKALWLYDEINYKLHRLKEIVHDADEESHPEHGP